MMTLHFKKRDITTPVQLREQQNRKRDVRGKFLPNLCAYNKCVSFRVQISLVRAWNQSKADRIVWQDASYGKAIQNLIFEVGAVLKCEERGNQM